MKKDKFLFDDIQESPSIRCKDCIHCMHFSCRGSSWNNCEIKTAGGGLKRVKTLEIHHCVNFKQIDNDETRR